MTFNLSLLIFHFSSFTFNFNFFSPIYLSVFPIHPSNHHLPSRFSCIPLFIHSSTPSCIYPFPPSTQLSIHPFIHPFINPSRHPCIHPLIHLYIHSSFHPPTHSSTHPLIHSHIHPPIHSSTHTFIHPSTHPHLVTQIIQAHPDRLSRVVRCIHKRLWIR